LHRNQQKKIKIETPVRKLQREKIKVFNELTTASNLSSFRSARLPFAGWGITADGRSDNCSGRSAILILLQFVK
jgi:hypothetical protein